MISLTNSLHVRKNIKFKFDAVRCIHHQNQKGHCKIIADESNFKLAYIYARSQIWIVPNFIIYCSKRPSNEFYILNPLSNLLYDDYKDFNYVLINNQKVFKLGTKYVAWELLILLNEFTITGDRKSIGILNIY